MRGALLLRRHKGQLLINLTRRRFLAAAAGTIAATIITPRAVASGRHDDWPREVTDALGRRVRIARPPTRIVPIFSSNTEIVVALGATERIVAIDGLTSYPPEILDRPRIGNRIGFSPDIIARLGADLVILTPARHAAAQLLRPMSLAGIPVLVLDHPTLARILTNIGLVGARDRQRAGGAGADPNDRRRTLGTCRALRVAVGQAGLLRDRRRRPCRLPLGPARHLHRRHPSPRRRSQRLRQPHESLAGQRRGRLPRRSRPHPRRRQQGGCRRPYRASPLERHPGRRRRAGQRDITRPSSDPRAPRRRGRAQRRPRATPQSRFDQPGMTRTLGIPTGWLAILIAAVFLSTGIAMMLGPELLGPGRVLDLLRPTASDHPLDRLLFDWRLPRVLTAFLVGGLLGAAGAIFQGIFRNPLADPFLIGTAPGAALGATLALLVPGSRSSKRSLRSCCCRSCRFWAPSARRLASSCLLASPRCVTPPACCWPASPWRRSSAPCVAI